MRLAAALGCALILAACTGPSGYSPTRTTPETSNAPSGVTISGHAFIGYVKDN